MKRFLKTVSGVVGVLSSVLVTSHAVQAQDRLPQMTVIMDDASELYSEIMTCRLGFDGGPSEKFQKGITQALVSAGLTLPESETLVKKLASARPLLSDDRPIVEAVLLCDSRHRDRKRDYDRFFDLQDRIKAAAALPAGRDDAAILNLMADMAEDRKAASTCVRLELGPFQRSEGIKPESAIGKELARFDLSPAVREHLDRTSGRVEDFSQTPTLGALRSFCKKRSDIFMKAHQEKKQLPNSFDALKALQPAAR